MKCFWMLLLLSFGLVLGGCQSDAEPAVANPCGSSASPVGASCCQQSAEALSAVPECCKAEFFGGEVSACCEENAERPPCCQEADRIRDSLPACCQAGIEAGMPVGACCPGEDG